MEKQVDRDQTTETSVASSVQEKENFREEDDVQIAVPNGRLGDSQVDNDGADGCDAQNGRPMSPATLALMCDEKDTIFTVAGSPNGATTEVQNTNHKSSNSQGNSENYAEVERFILTRAWDFLNRLITCGSIKGMGVLFDILYEFLFILIPLIRASWTIT